MAILLIDELRQHVEFPTGSDADDALQRLLDLTEAEIVRAAGPTGETTEYVDGRWLTGLILSRPIASLSSVTVDYDGTPIVLSADDYRFTEGGYVLHRLATGTNAATYWYGTVQVTYTAADDAALRAGVQIDLVRLAINSTPSVTSRSLGDWAETYALNSVFNPYIERDLILARLAPAAGMLVI
jgi:hypothetical protein